MFQHFLLFPLKLTERHPVKPETVTLKLMKCHMHSVTKIILYLPDCRWTDFFLGKQFCCARGNGGMTPKNVDFHRNRMCEMLNDGISSCYSEVKYTLKKINKYTRIVNSEEISIKSSSSMNFFLQKVIK